MRGHLPPRHLLPCQQLFSLQQHLPDLPQHGHQLHQLHFGAVPLRRHLLRRVPCPHLPLPRDLHHLRQSLRDLPQWSLLLLHMRKRVFAAQHHLRHFLPLFRLHHGFQFLRGLSDPLRQLRLLHLLFGLLKQLLPLLWQLHQRMPFDCSHNRGPDLHELCLLMRDLFLVANELSHLHPVLLPLLLHLRGELSGLLLL